MLCSQAMRCARADDEQAAVHDAWHFPSKPVCPGMGCSLSRKVCPDDTRCAGHGPKVAWALTIAFRWPSPTSGSRWVPGCLVSNKLGPVLFIEKRLWRKSRRGWPLQSKHDFSPTAVHAGPCPHIFFPAYRVHARRPPPCPACASQVLSKTDDWSWNMGNIVHTMTNRRYAEACVVRALEAISWSINH